MSLDALWYATSPALAAGVCTAGVALLLGAWLVLRAVERRIDATAGAE
jgi:hypothetical protein